MSMFVDYTKVNLRAGKGGDGMVAFRREKYEPNGGPAGGDGGSGGNIIFKVDEGLRTLVDFRYNPHFKADSGQNGMPKGMNGKKAEDLIISVPPGTIIRDAQSKAVLADLQGEGQEVLAAQGGRGGRGNKRFATHKNPAPSIAENGEPGQERDVELELKVMADVGLVGYPSVGKSTLLSVVSGAKPKIGAYHFTTLAPNLGVVNAVDGKEFVLADIPGLIEGASEGVGLGIDFLKHIERTRLLLHVLDMSGMEGRQPIDDFDQINQELKDYNEKLLDRKQVIVANKMDLPQSADNLAEFKAELASRGLDYEIFEVSAATQAGIQDLVVRLADLVDQLDKVPSLDQEEAGADEQRVVYKFQADQESFDLDRDPEGVWLVSGPKVERLYAMTNFDHEEAIMRFSRQLRGMGVDQALRDKGAQSGDLVQVEDFVFEFMD